MLLYWKMHCNICLNEKILAMWGWKRPPRSLNPTLVGTSMRNLSSNFLLYPAFHLKSWTPKHHHCHLSLSTKSFRVALWHSKNQDILRHSPDYSFLEYQTEENLHILYTSCDFISLNNKPQIKRKQRFRIVINEKKKYCYQNKIK